MIPESYIVEWIVPHGHLGVRGWNISLVGAEHKQTEQDPPIQTVPAYLV